MDAVDRTFRSVEAFEAEHMLRDYATDAMVIDPHYPTPRMQGHAVITDGLRSAFGSLQSMGFTITSYLEDATGQSAAVEVATHHVLRAGMHLRFPQMFVVEMQDGLITRLQAYAPYGPHGVGAVVLGLTRVYRKLSRHRVR